MCKARGVFRDRNIKPLVGDYVEIDNTNIGEAYIVEVFNRKNQLIRPPVVNVDQILLVQTIKSPALNRNTMDKYLIMLEYYDLPVSINFNKSDLVSKDEIEEIKNIYLKAGYPVLTSSVEKMQGIDDLEDLLNGKLTAFAGPSGVGKSSILNQLNKSYKAETGNISEKTMRGKHTTRHSEIFKIKDSTYILDTPGFSSLDLSFIKDEREVKEYFKEFHLYKKDCKFQDCLHINEPKCGVKEAVGNDKIASSRYENYLLIYEEVKKNRRY